MHAYHIISLGSIIPPFVLDVRDDGTALLAYRPIALLFLSFPFLSLFFLLSSSSSSSSSLFFSSPFPPPLPPFLPPPPPPPFGRWSVTPLRYIHVERESGCVGKRLRRRGERRGKARQEPAKEASRWKIEACYGAKEKEKNNVALDNRVVREFRKMPVCC